MDNTDLILKEIFTSTLLTKKQKILKAEEMLTEKIAIDTFNLELYFKLAVVVLEEPEIDFIKSIECMEKVLSYDKMNKEAIIFLSWIQYFYRGYVNSSALILLDNLLNDVKIDSLSKSLIYLSKSWSADIDEEQRFCFLEKSIESNTTYVHNYLELANLYRNKGDLDKEKDLILKALRNVEKIYLVDKSFDITVVKQYLGDCFKGFIDDSFYDIPTYNLFKREFILGNITDSYKISCILESISS